MSEARDKPTVIAILGPTATGKTALALRLAKTFPIEIISMDSALVYREMNIGTAKPSLAELAIAPHHLIDMLDPSEAYSAARFREDAMASIAAIHSRGRLPVLVGGTVLYFRALRDGLADMPDADASLRAELSERLAAEGSEALHAHLAEVDAEAAARIHPNDPQRILRALEVYQLTGKPLSAHIADQPAAPSLPFSLDTWVLQPRQRHWLHSRIARRFDTMLEAGFVDEVAGLRARGDLSPDMPSMRAVGYRQVWQYLDGEDSYQEMRDKGIAATRQFAKRQITWLRREQDAYQLVCEDPAHADKALRRVDGLK